MIHLIPVLLIVTGLQLQCGLLDITPMLTKNSHIGGMQLIAKTGPVDMRCDSSRYWESMWLLESCEELKSTNERIRLDVGLLEGLCKKTTRKIKKQFYNCHGVQKPRIGFELTDLISSDSHQRQQHLFCSFVADCGFDDFLSSCRNSLPLISRFISVCSDVEFLSSKCFNATPSTSISSKTLQTLNNAITGAHTAMLSLHPFIKVPAGLVTHKTNTSNTKIHSKPKRSANKNVKQKKKDRNDDDDETPYLVL